MSTSATKGAGCLFKRGGTTVAEVKSIGGPSITRDTHDVTHMESTWKEYIGGLPDGGEIPLDLNFLPASTHHTALHNAITSGTAAYQLVFNDASTTTWTVTGIITGFAPTASVDDRLRADVTVKLTDAVTFA